MFNYKGTEINNQDPYDLKSLEVCWEEQDSSGTESILSAIFSHYIGDLVVAGACQTMSFLLGSPVILIQRIVVAR